jgi:REP element-mobilizing transposase RayT
MRKERPDIARLYWRGTLRSPRFFAASTGGETLAVLRQDVERQRASSSP